MAKHYITIDENNFIIDGFSNNFREPAETDICINENANRQFKLKNQVNPSLIDDGFYIYKFVDNNIEFVTQEEHPNYKAKKNKEKKDKKKNENKEKIKNQTVTIYGKTYNADEVSLNRMMRSIMVMNNSEKIKWVLANDEIIKVNKANLNSVLEKAVRAEISIWTDFEIEEDVKGNNKDKDKNK